MRHDVVRPRVKLNTSSTFSRARLERGRTNLNSVAFAFNRFALSAFTLRLCASHDDADDDAAVVSTPLHNDIMGRALNAILHPRVTPLCQHDAGIVESMHIWESAKNRIYSPVENYYMRLGE